MLITALLYSFRSSVVEYSSNCCLPKLLFCFLVLAKTFSNLKLVTQFWISIIKHPYLQCIILDSYNYVAICSCIPSVFCDAWWILIISLFCKVIFSSYSSCKLYTVISFNILLQKCFHLSLVILYFARPLQCSGDRIRIASPQLTHFGCGRPQW